MIEIKRFREWLVEIKTAINERSDEGRVEHVAMAVHEGHMLRKLKDRRGIMLCARYPDCTQNGAGDAYSTDNEILIFIIEKVASGQHSDEEEIAHYESVQKLMYALREVLLDGELMCDESIRINSSMKIEWEYDIFGGWNGMSISFKLEDFL